MRRQLLLVLIASLLTPLAARAGSFQVSPIRLTLSARQPTGVVQITNNSNGATVIQVQVVAWTQQNGKDIYKPDRTLLATPPIFQLEGGGKQVVRVGLRGKPDPSQETSYRLFMTQVPPPPEQGFQGLRIALRIGIPVFVEPATQTAPLLHWSAKRLSSEKIELSAANTGNAHVQIISLSLTPTTGKPLEKRIGAYLLPGTKDTWTLKFHAPLRAGSALEITADTDQGKFHAKLPLE